MRWEVCCIVEALYWMLRTWNSVWLSYRLTPAWPSAVCLQVLGSRRKWGQHPCPPPVLPSQPCPLLETPPSPGFCWPQLLPLPQITEAMFVFLFFLFHFIFLFILLPDPITLPLGNHSDVLTVNVLFAYVLEKLIFCLDTNQLNLCKWFVLCIIFWCSLFFFFYMGVYLEVHPVCYLTSSL